MAVMAAAQVVVIQVAETLAHTHTHTHTHTRTQLDFSCNPYDKHPNNQNSGQQTGGGAWRDGCWIVGGCRLG